MPYKIIKRKCRPSDGDAGSYVLAYKTKKGKQKSNCHTSRSKARKQIAAIEMPESAIREMISMILEVEIGRLNDITQAGEVSVYEPEAI